MLRGQPLLGALALLHLLPERLVDGGQLSGPLRNPPLELLRLPSLLAQASSLLEAHRRLVRRHPQQYGFDLRREINPTRAGHQHSDFVLNPQLDGRDGDITFSNRIGHDHAGGGRIEIEPAIECEAKVPWPSGLIQPLCDPRGLDRRAAIGIDQPDIGEVQTQRAQQRVEQRVRDAGGFALDLPSSLRLAGPNARYHGWKTAPSPRAPLEAGLYRARRGAPAYSFRGRRLSLPVDTKRLLFRGITGASREHVWCGRSRSCPSWQRSDGAADPEAERGDDWRGRAGGAHGKY